MNKKNATNTHPPESSGRLNLVLTVINVIAAVISSFAAITANNQSQQTTKLMSEQNQLIERSISPDIKVRISRGYGRYRTYCLDTPNSVIVQQRSLRVVQITNNGGGTASLVEIQPDNSNNDADQNLYDVAVFTHVFVEQAFQSSDYTIYRGEQTLTFGEVPINIPAGTSYFIPLEQVTYFTYNPQETEEINKKWGYDKTIGNDPIQTDVSFNFGDGSRKTIMLPVDVDDLEAAPNSGEKCPIEYGPRHGPKSG